MPGYGLADWVSALEARGLQAAGAQGDGLQGALPGA